MNATRTTAIASARASGEARVLIELDYEDTRRTIVARPEYLDSPEFEAFEGAIVGWAYPTGEYERCN